MQVMLQKCRLCRIKKQINNNNTRITVRNVNISIYNNLYYFKCVCVHICVSTQIKQHANEKVQTLYTRKMQTKDGKVQLNPAYT